MKHLLVSVGLLFCTGPLFAQTTQLNQEKYWKFRNSFKEKFVKIGPLNGESLPAGMLKPFDCVDTYDDIEDGSGMGATPYGEMHWGDGMIRHGHYLTLLATEYRLLKNNGQAEQARATLNELYYALNVIRRLDLVAEEHQDVIHGTNTTVSPLNGFYNREDVGEDFATLNWGTERIRMACTNSAFYWNNNSKKLNTGTYKTRGNSYQNVPSQDQMSSLLVGLSMVMKFVPDGGTVQPTPQDPAKDLYLDAKDRMYNIIQYGARNNWFILDVHGWPVNNGSGDLVLTAPALIRIHERFIGSGLNTLAHRKLLGYKNVQGFVTGYGLEGPYEGDLSWPQQVLFNIAYVEIMEDIHWCFPAVQPQFQNSKFANWQNCGIEIDVNSLVMRNLWMTTIPSNYVNFYNDYLDDHQFNTTFGMGGLGSIDFGDNLPFNDYNTTLLFNFGVCTGWWNAATAHQWASVTDNRQLELVNYLLNNQTPVESAAFYKAYLDGLSFTGPYNLEAGYYNNATYQVTNVKQLYHNNGWASMYRWTHPNESINIGGEKGIYSGLDYMVFYNLYHLQFASQLPEYKESWTCNCAPEPVATGTINEPNDQVAYNNLNAKLDFVENCQENVFYPVNNLVTAVFDIQPKFSTYSALGIYTTKYQTQNAGIVSGGDVNVKTRFVICNASTLNIQAGGRLDVEQKEMIVNTGGIVNNSGELIVRKGTQLVLKPGSRLILNNGAKLVLEDSSQLIIDEGGTLEYYNGANFYTEGSKSKIILRGGIKAMNAATFTIGTTAAVNTPRGKFIVEGNSASFTALQPSSFTLSGTGISDPFIEVNSGSRLLVDHAGVTDFKISSCSVKLLSGAYINASRPFYATHVRFFSNHTNGGLTVSNANHLASCEFVEVPVKGVMNILNNSSLRASGCVFSSAVATQNPTDLALLTVTGMGYELNNCNFGVNRDYCVRSSAMTVPSNVISCTFSRLAISTAGSLVTGIFDLSNTEIRCSTSSFTQCLTGISKSSGKLSLRCNTFSGNNLNNISVQNGCLLNMSTTDVAGYNVLNKSLQNKSIALSASSLNLKNGYNFIEQCTNTITGTATIACTPPGCQIDLANNQWNTANTVPATTQFQITTTPYNYVVLPLVSTVAVKPACGANDGPIGPVPPIKNKSTIASDGTPLIWSELAGDSIRLDDAIAYGMQRMTAYDSLGNDLEAVEHFNEIYTNELDLSDSLTNYLAWFTLGQMKSSLENAVGYGHITAADNAAEFEEHVAMYVHALMVLSDSVITEDNALVQFYHEIDKAHLFRVIGHSQTGLNILTELEYCGLDSVQQSQLNYWKTEFAKDLVIDVIGQLALDSVIVIDTADYIQPVPLMVSAYSFGARINGLNDISYPNCHFYGRSAKKVNKQGFALYPNPAAEEVFIGLKPVKVPGACAIVIVQSDGRIVYAQSVASTEKTVRIDVSGWQPGAYTVKCTNPDGQVDTGKLIVQ